jgi:hypothetical protein
MAICIFSERFQVWKNMYPPPIRMPNITHQYATKNSDRAMTNSVGAGRSAPNDLNTSLNAGMTLIMITVSTTNATTITEIGYISADLILLLSARIFSW